MSLVRNFTTVGGATMLSRVLGFMRDVLLAGRSCRYGAGRGRLCSCLPPAEPVSQAVCGRRLQFRLHSAVRPGGGGEEGDEGARRFAGEIGAALLFCLLALTAVAQIFMPFVVLGPCAGFQRRQRQVRPDRADGAHRLSLPDFHVAAGVPCRHSEYLSAFCRGCLCAGHAERGHEHCSGRCPVRRRGGQHGTRHYPERRRHVRRDRAAAGGHRRPETARLQDPGFPPPLHEIRKTPACTRESPASSRAGSPS